MLHNASRDFKLAPTPNHKRRRKKMDETQSLEALSDLLTKISESPYDLSLHAQHIQLATASGMEDQLVAARQMLTSFWPTGDEVWLPIINAHIEQGLDTPEKVLEALTLFQTAEDDYLCAYISRTKRH